MEPFAWPLGVVVIAIMFMIIFRDPIKALLGRTTAIRKLGLETHDQAQIPAPADSQQALQDFMAAWDNPILTEQEDIILGDLADRGLNDPDAARQALVRTLAGFQILLVFEKIQTTIFASQIELLTLLNGVPDGIDETRSTLIFDEAAASWPDLYEDGSFNDWLGYLDSYSLVILENDCLKLTQVGREFLKWRLHEGRVGPNYG